MTILATHFAIVLGAWRLRVRIDIDEPRASEIDEAQPAPRPHDGSLHGFPEYAARGRG
jgi:hypothetical protein